MILPESGNLEWYYLGIHRKESRFEDGIGDETRHTLGGRFWKYGGGFIYNFEMAYQFGNFNKGTISAWTASADIGYMFENVKGKPTINLRNDYISGDKIKETENWGLSIRSIRKVGISDSIHRSDL
jgi:hypothetical protein